MASLGPNYPDTSEVFDDGTAAEDWVDPDYCRVDDTNYAAVHFATIFGDDNGTYTGGLAVHDFDFTVPAGSTITGVYVELDLYCEGGVGNKIQNYNMDMSDATGTFTPSTRWALANQTYASVGWTNTWGNSTHTWNTTTLTPTLVNSTGFGFVTRWYWERSSGVTNVIGVDSWRCTVYYTPPGYAHKPFSIAATSVGKIMGVNSSSVKKFMGV